MLCLLEPTEEDLRQPYIAQIWAMVSVLEGEYRGALFLDDFTLIDAHDTSIVVVSPRTTKLKKV